ncbi:MAG: hypothetical protein H6581_08310 [Bacteroidia bacterium]|nr:hypothetical protein [Bacteroidia bacterium]
MKKHLSFTLTLILLLFVQTVFAQSPLEKKFTGAWQLFEEEVENDLISIEKGSSRYWEYSFREDLSCTEYTDMYDRTDEYVWEVTDSKEILLSKMEEIEPAYGVKFKPSLVVFLRHGSGEDYSELLVRKVKKDLLEIYTVDGGVAYGVLRFRRFNPDLNGVERENE